MTQKDEVTLAQAKQIILSMGMKQSILMLASPGVGKSDIVKQIADDIGYRFVSLLGTQIAPEDVSGIPRIEGEGKNQRSVFYPPKMLLPTDDKPFVLFLDELPICNQEVQKAMYSLLLDRRLGDHKLPEGTIVVSAGNNIEDKAFVRAMSTALVNRVIILHIKVSVDEWLAWGSQTDEKGRPFVRDDVRAFIAANDFCLQYKDNKTGSKVPNTPDTPFSTPRSWAALSNAMDRLEAFRKNPSSFLKGQYGSDKVLGTLGEASNADGLTDADIRILAYGSVSPADAEAFCTFMKYDFQDLKSADEYIKNPKLIPSTDDGDIAESDNDSEGAKISDKVYERAIIFRQIQRAFMEPKSKVFKAIEKLGGEVIDSFFETMPKEWKTVMINEKIMDFLKKVGAKKTLKALRKTW